MVEVTKLELLELQLGCRLLQLEFRQIRYLLERRAGFRPDQPRVPAGRPDGGRWTDAGPGGLLQPVNARRPRSGQPIIINGRLLEMSPAQATRMSMADMNLRAALARVREVDPRWRPTPQAYETIEGQIRSLEAQTAEANSRALVVKYPQTGPGPFAREWVTLPPNTTGRRVTAAQRREIERIGREFGCHRCGSRNPGTPLDRWVVDHQSALKYEDVFRLYPHCATCSASQGGRVRHGIEGVVGGRP
jgi:hypothetical protein